MINYKHSHRKSTPQPVNLRKPVNLTKRPCA